MQMNLLQPFEIWASDLEWAAALVSVINLVLFYR